MRNKLMLTALCVILTAALAGGATFALFTGTATNNNIDFAAGSVDIAADRDLGDPIPGPMFYTTIAEGVAAPGQEEYLQNPTGLWWPGRSVNRNLDVRNLGSLRVRLNQVSAEITSINGQSPADLPVLAASFASKMDVKIFVAGQPNSVLYDGSLENLLSAPQTAIHRPLIAPFTGVWPPMVQLIYEVTMLSSAGNDLQGVVPVVAFFIHAEQTANNP